MSPACLGPSGPGSSWQRAPITYTCLMSEAMAGWTTGEQACLRLAVVFQESFSCRHHVQHTMPTLKNGSQFREEAAEGWTSFPNKAGFGAAGQCGSPCANIGLSLAGLRVTVLLVSKPEASALL